MKSTDAIGHVDASQGFACAHRSRKPLGPGQLKALRADKDGGLNCVVTTWGSSLFERCDVWLATYARDAMVKKSWDQSLALAEELDKLPSVGDEKTEIGLGKLKEAVEPWQEIPISWQSSKSIASDMVSQTYDGYIKESQQLLGAQVVAPLLEKLGRNFTVVVEPWLAQMVARFKMSTPVNDETTVKKWSAVLESLCAVNLLRPSGFLRWWAACPKHYTVFPRSAGQLR